MKQTAVCREQGKAHRDSEKFINSDGSSFHLRGILVSLLRNVLDKREE